jgi:Mce-associated membrane protein
VSIYEADGWVTAGQPKPAQDGPADQAEERQQEPVTGPAGDAGQAGADQSPPAGPAGHSRLLVRLLPAGGLRGLPRRSLLRAGRLPLRWRVTSMAVLGVLAAGAGAAAVRLAAEAHHDDALTRARSTALAAATTDIRQILSYNYRSINSDLARARNDTTGQFRGEFGVLASQLIGPAAAQQRTITWATVPHASVVSATADQVVVLLFIDQRTASKTQPQPQLAASQVQVTMQRIGGRWLVAQFQAL